MLLLYHSSIFGCEHSEPRDVPVYFVMLSASEASWSDDTTRFFAHAQNDRAGVLFVMLSISEASWSDDTTRFFASLRMTGRRDRFTYIQIITCGGVIVYLPL